jgi:hypothetical protein
VLRRLEAKSTNTDAADKSSTNTDAAVQKYKYLLSIECFAGWSQKVQMLTQQTKAVQILTQQYKSTNTDAAVQKYKYLLSIACFAGWSRCESAKPSRTMLTYADVC